MRRVLLLVLPLALAACGGRVDSDERAEVEADLARAAARTANVASGRFELAGRFDFPAGQHLTIRGRGEFADQGRLTQTDWTFEGGKGRARLRAVTSGGLSYIRSPLFTDLLPPGKQWFKFEDTERLAEIWQNDSGQMLAFLRATSQVEEIGSERVRGVETIHYRADVDLDKTVDLAPAGERDRVRAMLAPLQNVGIDELPLDVWLDGEGLARRVALDLSVEDASIEWDIGLFDFGADIEIEVPDPAVVAPAPPQLRTDEGYWD